jgi:hypothetical protein
MAHGHNVSLLSFWYTNKTRPCLFGLAVLRYAVNKKLTL